MRGIVQQHRAHTPRLVLISIQPIIGAVFGAYFLTLMAIAVFGAARMREMADYVLAGRRMSSFTSALSASSSATSPIADYRRRRSRVGGACPRLRSRPGGVRVGRHGRDVRAGHGSCALLAQV